MNYYEINKDNFSSTGGKQDKKVLLIKQEVHIRDLLHSCPKSDLIDIAASHKIKVGGKKKKVQLVKLLAEKIIEENQVKKVFTCFLDQQIEVIEKIIKSQRILVPSQEEVARIVSLFYYGYAYTNIDSEMIIPIEIEQVYEKIDTREFHDRRKLVSWVLACLKIAIALHGLTPTYVMLKILNINEEIKFDEKMLFECFKEIRGLFPGEYLFCNGYFVPTYLLPKTNYELVLKSQGNQEYYIPTHNEILTYSFAEHFIENESLHELLQYAMCNMFMSTYEARSFCMYIQTIVSKGRTITDVIEIIAEITGKEYLLDDGFDKDNEEVKEVGQMVLRFWKDTRTVLFRGFKPNELFATNTI